jgi:protein ImuB
MAFLPVFSAPRRGTRPRRAPWIRQVTRLIHVQAVHGLRYPSAEKTFSADGYVTPAWDMPAPLAEPAYQPLWLAIVFGSLPDGQLETLAERCRYYTSEISVAPPDAVLLEIRGSLRLFGGLSPLIESIARTLAGRGYEVTLAATPVPSASLILVRQGKGVLIEDRAQLRTVLAGLPVRALEIPAEQLRRLERMGISRLMDLWRLPRDGLARRFGAGFLTQLDKLMGHIPDFRPAYRPPLRFTDACTLPAETADATFILAAARRLLSRLITFLKNHDAAIGGFCLILKPRRHSSIECLPIECRIGLRSRTRDLRRLEHLLAERLHALRLPAPVLEMELRAEDIRQYTPTTESLLLGRPEGGFSPPENAGPDLQSERIWETLEARLGRGCITVPACHADHRPERAGGESASSGAGHEPYPNVRRPLWLLDPPEPLAGNLPPRWQGKALSLRSGPERIEAGWWDGAERRRDYFRAVTADGRQLWVFRNLDSPHEWHLHGYWG